MAELIVIERSVGANASNLALDVVKIGAALVALGPDRGGIFGVPLSINGLAEAIRLFQDFQKLPVRDGKVDPGGSTLKRINALLNPGALPAPPSPIARTGNVRHMPDMSASVNTAVWSPVEASLVSEMVFKWSALAGSGKILYFELDEDVVPNWFGVLVPTGLTNFERVHIFFHPTPGQAGYIDANYRTKAGWRGVFHYLTDSMAVQFCAANTGQVLVMPLLTQSAAGSCGILPQRWESIIGQMLGQIASGTMSQSASPQSISSVVVSSFSSGITYSSAFRNSAKLGGRLRGVIDFDGIISSYRGKSRELPASAVRMWQTGAPAQNLPALAASNIFPLPQARWEGGPYKGLFKGNVVLQIHGTIPQTMMFVAAKRTGMR